MYPKRRHAKTATNQNGDKPKRRQIQNGDKSKRRQIKTATLQNSDNQNGDTFKTATRQNGDTSKMATTKTATYQNGACRRFGLSPFWLYPKRRHAKAATSQRDLYTKLIQNAVFTCIQNGDTPKRRQTKTATNQNGDKSKTATNQNGDRSKRRHSKTATTKTATRSKRRHAKTATHPKWRQPKRRHTKTVHVAVLVCHRFGCILNGDTPKRRQANVIYIQNLSKTPCLLVSKTATRQNGDNQNGDTFKTATRQNGDTSKMATTKTATYQNGACRRFGLSPFWLYPKRRHAKTATSQRDLYTKLIQNAVFTCIQNGDTPKRRQTKTATNQNGDKSKTATNQNGDRSKRRHSKTATTKTATRSKRRHAKTATHPKWRQPKRRHIKTVHVAVLVCHRFGCILNGDTPKRRQANVIYIQNLSKTPCLLVSKTATRQNGDKFKTATLSKLNLIL